MPHAIMSEFCRIARQLRCLGTERETVPQSTLPIPNHPPSIPSLPQPTRQGRFFLVQPPEQSLLSLFLALQAVHMSGTSSWHVFVVAFTPVSPVSMNDVPSEGPLS